MNRFYSVPFKTLAVLLSFVFLVIIVLGCLSVVLFFETGIYTASAAEVYSNVAVYIIGIDAYKIFADLDGIGKMPGYYRYGVRFDVTDEYGNVLYNDLYDLDYDLSYTADFEAYHWGGLEEFPDSVVESDEGLRAHIEMLEDVEYVEPVTYSDGYYREGYYLVHTGFPDRDCMVTAYLITGENWAEYNLLCRGIPLAYSMRFWIVPIIIFSLLCFILLIVYLMCSAGHRKGVEGVQKSSIDRVPFDIHTLAIAGIIFLFAQRSFVEGLERSGIVG